MMEEAMIKGLVTVAGRDRIGIIGRVCTKLSELAINILDISQTVMQEYFTMIMIVDISGSDMPFDKISETLEKLGTDMGLSIRIQRIEIFDAMHKI